MPSREAKQGARPIIEDDSDEDSSNYWFKINNTQLFYVEVVLQSIFWEELQGGNDEFLLGVKVLQMIF